MKHLNCMKNWVHNFRPRYETSRPGAKLVLRNWPNRGADFLYIFHANSQRRHLEKRFSEDKSSELLSLGMKPPMRAQNLSELFDLFYLSSTCWLPWCRWCRPSPRRRWRWGTWRPASWRWPRCRIYNRTFLYMDPEAGFHQHEFSQRGKLAPLG
jgi:hypothetical protein